MKTLRPHRALHPRPLSPPPPPLSRSTNVQLWTATSPLGPYTNIGNLIPGGGAWGAQTGSVWFTGEDYVLFGDRWQSAPAPQRLKSSDFSYWTPITFFANGTVQAQPVFQADVTINY
jgi:hypothetical protein